MQSDAAIAMLIYDAVCERLGSNAERRVLLEITDLFHVGFRKS